MKLIIDKNRKVYSAGTWGTKNENNYEILDFEFPEELEEYNKRIVYYLGDERVWDAIVNNKAYITNAITKYEKVNAYVWLTKNETITLKYVCDGTEEGNYYFTYDNVNYYFTMPEVEENDELIFDVATSTLKLDNTTIATTSIGAGTELTFETIIDAEEDFRTQLFEMQFYENENADGIVPTEQQVDGFNTMLTAMNAKIDEVDALETTIETAEAQRQEAEATRVSNENTRETNESTRQTNEQTRQSQEADRERRTNEAISSIQDKTAEYNANAEAKTTAFNNNATQKTNDFNNNYTQKVNDFNTNASSKTSAFNSNAEAKTNTFNTNATNKTNAFNSNATEKTTTFNDNASTKTSEFNTNAESKTSAFNDNATQKTTNFDNNASSKTTTFNENATSKTNDFNDNATQKTTAFNNNAQAKTEAFDEHTAEITADIEDLQQEVEELSENMPWAETEQATEISVDDAAKYSKNKLELFGNTSQDSTSISGGDEYDSPSPDHPQPIHVVTGNNSVEIQGRNLFDENILKQETNYNTYDSTTQLWTTNSGGSYGRSILYNATGYTSRNINKLVPLTSAGTYTLKLYDFVNNTSYASALELALFDNEGSKISQTAQSSNFIKFTIDIPCYMDLCRRNNSGTISFSKVMLVQGDYTEQTLPDYTPYYHADYPINLGSLELCKIGDYQDYLYKENGNWYVKKEIGKVVFNGSENWLMNYGEGLFHGAVLGNQKNPNIGLCNYFIFNKRTSGMSTLPDGCFALQHNYNAIFFRKNNSATINEFKNWLSTHNLVVYSILAETTDTQITDETLISQLEAIYNHLALVKGTNHITVTASDLAPYVTLNYMQDLPSKLDNLDSRLALLE